MRATTTPLGLFTAVKIVEVVRVLGEGLPGEHEASAAVRKLPPRVAKPRRSTRRACVMGKMSPPSAREALSGETEGAKFGRNMRIGPRRKLRGHAGSSKVRGGSSKVRAGSARGGTDVDFFWTAFMRPEPAPPTSPPSAWVPVAGTDVAFPSARWTSFARRIPCPSVERWTIAARKLPHRTDR